MKVRKRHKEKIIIISHIDDDELFDSLVDEITVTYNLWRSFRE